MGTAVKVRGVRAQAREFPQGLAANWQQFALQMVLIVAVGMTIGTERTVLPLLGKQAFHVQSFVLIGSFVTSFGLVKAAMNLLGGGLSERYGRRPVLIAGWLSALPVPALLILAPSWSWVIFANVLLGINQGLAWSMSVNAKIDLAGSRHRGLAVGLDEAGGYGGVALAALITGYLAAAFGLRPAPFIFGGLVIAVALLMGIFLVEETLPYALAEARHAPEMTATPLALPRVFLLASFQDRTLLAINQAGTVEKFVDALVWVGVPLYLASRHLPIAHIGEVVFAYGIVWGLGQIPAGHVADLVGRKIPIATGMLVCAIGVLLLPLASSLGGWLLAAALIGGGMALLYPNLMTAAADASPPAWRASGLGVYRFWRDLGYALGAVGVGLVANAWGLAATFFVVAVAMGVSTLWLVTLMKETRPLGQEEAIDG